MELVTKKLSELKPYPNNPRVNDAAVEAVAKSIEQCEYVAPIIVDEDMVILAGHTRLKALESLGMTEAEVVIKSGLTDEQKRKYRVLDNKTNELSEWDFDKLAEEIEELDFGDLDLDFGIDLDEPEEVVEDDFDMEPPEEPKAKRGDVYQLGRHRLMCGDSTDARDVKILMGGQLADLLLTDPPYGVSYSGGTNKDGLTMENDDKRGQEFIDFLEKSFRVANSDMKTGAAFYIWYSDIETDAFRTAVLKSGWTIRQVLIWVKNSMTVGRQDYQWKHEPCLYGWKDGASHFWSGDRRQTTVLEYDRPKRSAEHPTMKPIALFSYLMGNNTKSGDIVLDLFGGSGTTIIAAEQNGRAGYLMEIDPRYCDVIINRWEQFTGEKAVLINGETTQGN